jgi:signal transduction histidine kinase
MNVANVAKDQAPNRADAREHLVPQRPQLKWMRLAIERSVARSRVFDAVLALLVCTFDVSQLFDPPPSGSTGRAVIGAFLLASVSVPLLWRRRRPLTVLAIEAAVALAWTLIPLVAEPPLHHFNASFFAFVVSLYSTGLYGASRKASMTAALVALGSVLTAVAFLDKEFSSRPRAFLFNASIVIVFFYVGYIGRVRRDYLEERAARVERERENEAHRAVAKERARIARELHDVVAHSVGLMTVQAGAAHMVSAKDPDAAFSSLSSIERTGRQALGELRWLLGILRTEDEAGELSPQPGLDRLDELVADVEEAGVEVEVTVEGDLQDLPTALALSAYRILQEGLTNVLKHAGRWAHAEVVVLRTHDELVLEVADDGRGVVSEASNVTGGHGLIGMRERVALFEGRMSTGPRRGGGFFVRTEIPLERGRQ